MIPLSAIRFLFSCGDGYVSTYLVSLSEPGLITGESLKQKQNMTLLRMAKPNVSLHKTRLQLILFVIQELKASTVRPFSYHIVFPKYCRLSHSRTLPLLSLSSNHVGIFENTFVARNCLFGGGKPGFLKEPKERVTEERQEVYYKWRI